MRAWHFAELELQGRAEAGQTHTVLLLDVASELERRAGSRGKRESLVFTII